MDTTIDDLTRRLHQKADDETAAVDAIPDA
jgi:hypothetical protein